MIVMRRCMPLAFAAQPCGSSLLARPEVDGGHLRRSMRGASGSALWLPLPVQRFCKRLPWVQMPYVLSVVRHTSPPVCLPHPFLPRTDSSSLNSLCSTSARCHPPPRRQPHSRPSSPVANAIVCPRTRMKSYGRHYSKLHSWKVGVHTPSMATMRVKLTAAVSGRPREIRPGRIQVAPRTYSVPQPQQVHLRVHPQEDGRDTHSEAGRESHPAAPRHERGEAQ